MQIVSVPTITLICYMIGEIYKVIFKNKESVYKLLPVIVSLIGGLLGILIYLTNKEMILNASNVWVALTIGVVSGASATTTNQIVKQVLKKQ